ncbi:MAG: glycosyltransferase family 9 protein [Pedosphaera sp.]|nr:glycosyltransferase family 9 protein [Pedosphaera sp.]
MQDINNILFIKLKSMGDVVFTLPALGLLRDNFPTARITYLTSAENAPIVACFKEVDEVLTLDRKIFKQGKLLAMGAQTFDLLRRLRRGRFSLAIDLQCYAETAALAWFTHADQRWGYQLGGRLRRFAYTRSFPKPGDLNSVDGNLKLLTHFGLKPSPVRNRLQLPDQGRAEAAQFLAHHNLQPDVPTIFIQPFTSSPHKNWPLSSHLVVADYCRARGLQLIFGGGPGEVSLLQPALAAGFPVCAGHSLAAVAWLVNQSAFVLGGDTGLLHLAVAMGKRVLMLMVPWGPGSCTPYGHPDWVLAPVRSPQLSEITPDAVNQAIVNALGSESICALPSAQPRK